MRMNLLKLNNGKTKFIIIGMRQQLELIGEIEISIGTDTVKPTPWVRNLGYFYASELKRHIHVAKLVSLTFITICRISRVRHLLNNDTCKTLSKLWCCQSLIIAIASYWEHQSTCYIIYRKSRIWQAGLSIIIGNMTVLQKT